MKIDDKEPQFMMRKKLSPLFIVLILCVCTLLFAGCGAQQKEEETTPAVQENDSSVTGTWSEDVFDSGYVFNSDGTGRDTFWDLSFTYTAYDGVMTITYDDDTYGVDRYQYSADETTLSMTRQGGDGKSFTYTKRG